MQEPKSIGGLADLVQLVAETHVRFKQDPWFRGHAKPIWKLVPKIFRDEREDRRARETSMFFRFLANAPVRYPGCPPASARGDWLVLMQHYGLPTRLLDWTLSPLVAGFFAVCEYPLEEGAIWALAPHTYNRLKHGEPVVYGMAHKNVLPIVNPAGDLQAKEVGKNAAVFPSQFDLRLVLQHSCFTIHDSGTPLEDDPQRGQFLTYFRVPVEAKKKVLVELMLCGIKGSTLFPDLEHLAEDISRRVALPERVEEQ